MKQNINRNTWKVSKLTKLKLMTFSKEVQQKPHKLLIKKKVPRIKSDQSYSTKSSNHNQSQNKTRTMRQKEHQWLIFQEQSSMNQTQKWSTIWITKRMWLWSVMLQKMVMMPKISTRYLNHSMKWLQMNTQQMMNQTAGLSKSLFKNSRQMVDSISLTSPTHQESVSHHRRHKVRLMVLWVQMRSKRILNSYLKRTILLHKSK